MFSAEKIIPLVCVGITVFAVLSATTLAQAAPMKCSTEEKTCAAACTKAARTAVRSCVTACGARASYCMKTGCWDNGTRVYCGLAKQ